jgi:hypothetical protein
VSKKTGPAWKCSAGRARKNALDRDIVVLCVAFGDRNVLGAPFAMVPLYLSEQLGKAVKLGLVLDLGWIKNTNGLDL